MKQYENVYRSARMQAAQRSALFSSRERAAAELYVSTEALQDYETGKTLPPCDVVERMVECYEAPQLKVQHIRAYCPLLPDYGCANDARLPLAALAWVLEAPELQSTARMFAEMARDGKIDATELETAKRIRAKAVELRQLMEQSITAIDTAMMEVRQ